MAEISHLQPTVFACSSKHATNLSVPLTCTISLTKHITLVKDKKFCALLFFKNSWEKKEKKFKTPDRHIGRFELIKRHTVF